MNTAVWIVAICVVSVFVYSFFDERDKRRFKLMQQNMTDAKQFSEEFEARMRKIEDRLANLETIVVDRGRRGTLDEDLDRLERETEKTI